MKRQYSSHCFTVLFFVAIILFSSCGSRRDIVYFQHSEEIMEALAGQEQIEYQTKIMPNDNLFIMVSHANQDAVEMYNPVNLNRGRNLSVANLDIFGYLVDSEGNINMPQLGEIHVAGLTKAEAIQLLQEKISKDVEDPIVNIRFLNYKISVIGEVSRPGVYTVTDERVSVPQAIALAGDLTIFGKRQDVQLIRIENGEKKFYTIDLTSPEIFFSPNYYLRQNDILYVSPNKTKAGSSTYNQYVPLTLSITSLAITIISFITRNR